MSARRDKELELVCAFLIIIACMVYGVFQIIWANECAHVGGAYIIPQNSWPVCVQGVKP